MTILVTGGSGFVGSSIVELLAQSGHSIIVPTRVAKNSWRLQGIKNVQIIEGDLADQSFQENLFKSHKPAIVIHAAWEGMTSDKRDDPSQINNLIMTDHLLQMTAAYKCSLFIGIGSQAEYGVYNKEITEDFATNPDNLYGIFKLSAALLGKWYANKHGFNYAWLRLFSSFGPKDAENYIIPYTTRCLLKEEAPKLGTCEQQWDYLYVRDLAVMVAKVIEKKGQFCDIYNLSSGQSVRLRQVVDMLKTLTQAKVSFQFGAQPPRPNGLMYLNGNNQKFQSTFGQINFTPLKQALEETVQWNKQHLS